MPRDIRVVRLGEFLRTDVKGNVDLAASREMLEDIVAVGKVNPSLDVLIDSRKAASTASAVDVFELAASLGESGLSPKTRIAIVNQPKDEFDRASLLEICARNRGFQIRAFREFEAAVTWLASDAPEVQGAEIPSRTGKP